MFCFKSFGSQDWRKLKIIAHKTAYEPENLGFRPLKEFNSFEGWSALTARWMHDSPVNVIDKLRMLFTGFITPCSIRDECFLHWRETVDEISWLFRSNAKRNVLATARCYENPALIVYNISFFNDTMIVVLREVISDS